MIWLWKIDQSMNEELVSSKEQRYKKYEIKKRKMLNSAPDALVKHIDIKYFFELVHLIY
jgi:hypothetical protein